MATEIYEMQVCHFLCFGVCYRVREPPPPWLCVPEAEIHQAPVKSFQVLWPGAKGQQLAVEVKGTTLGLMALPTYNTLLNACACHQFVVQ